MTLPNFLGIGTQRAATTWLFDCLREHPNVFVPECKEVSFFNQHYDKGISYYSSYFKEASGYKALGEITPDYLHNRECPSRIYKELHNPMMIVILRNPIERAFSAYHFFIQNKYNWTFEETIKKRPFILDIGLYYKHLIRFFEKNRFHILLYEDLARDNLSAIVSIYKFLGINDRFRPRWVGKTNNTKYFPKLTEFLETSHLGWGIELVKRTPVGSSIRSIHKITKQTTNHNIDKDTRNSLRNFYKDSNRNLENIIGKDLSMWI